MSDNLNFWGVLRAGQSPERKKIRSEKSIITARFAKIRYETKKRFLVTKREFREWSLANTEFNSIYEKYSESGDKRHSPVIELKSKREGYILENMRWVCQKDKSRSNGRPVKMVDADGQEIFFSSARKAEFELKIPRGILNRAVRTSGKYKGFQISLHL